VVNLLETFVGRVIAQRGLPWVGDDALRFEQVLEVPDMALAPAMGVALREAAENPQLGALFHKAYLPRISADDFQTAEREAAPPSGVDPSQAAEEWVSAVGGQNGDAVTLPADSLSLHRMSLFTDVDGRVGRVSAEVNERAQLSGVSVSAGGHCAYPDRLRCDAGTCGGCRLELREVGQRGWICVCSHQR
jgi:hypothetical protein